MYKVYGKIASRALRVLWVLEEIGVPYEFIEAGPHSDAVLAANPSGKIPILIDGNAVITDSTAIITYLADKHGMLTNPAGTIDRAHQDALTNTVLDELDAVLWMSIRHKLHFPNDHGTAEVLPNLKLEFAHSIDRLASRFQGPFLQGDTVTIADIVLVHCLNWAKSAGFPVESDTLKTYAREMRARDAFKRVLALQPA